MNAYGYIRYYMSKIQNEYTQYTTIYRLYIVEADRFVLDPLRNP